jgi:hypothetical protein
MMERRYVRSSHGRQRNRPEARKDVETEVQAIVAHGGRLLLEFCMLREEALRQVGHGDRLRDRPDRDGGVSSIVRLGEKLRGLASRPNRLSAGRTAPTFCSPVRGRCVTSRLPTGERAQSPVTS